MVVRSNKKLTIGVLGFLATLVLALAAPVVGAVLGLGLGSWLLWTSRKQHSTPREVAVIGFAVGCILPGLAALILALASINVQSPPSNQPTQFPATPSPTMAP